MVDSDQMDDNTEDPRNTETRVPPQTIRPPSSINVREPTQPIQTTTQLIATHRQKQPLSNPYIPNPKTISFFPALPYMIRYETRISLDPSEKPNDECWLKLHAFLKTIMDADKSAVLYPWNDEDNKGPPAARKYKALTDPKVKQRLSNTSSNSNSLALTY